MRRLAAGRYVEESERVDPSRRRAFLSFTLESLFYWGWNNQCEDSTHELMTEKAAVLCVQWNRNLSLRHPVHLSFPVSPHTQRKPDVLFFFISLLLFFLSLAISAAHCLTPSYVFFFIISLELIHFLLILIRPVSASSPRISPSFCHFLKKLPTFIPFMFFLKPCFTSPVILPYFFPLSLALFSPSPSSLLALTELFQRCLEYFWLCDSSGQHHWHPGDRAWGK